MILCLSKSLVSNYDIMPKTNMYVYDDVVDSRIRRFIASKLMNESEFLKKNHLSSGTL